MSCPMGMVAAACVPGACSCCMVVGPGTGDNAGAALGLGLERGDVVVSLGTSGAVFADAASPVRPTARGGRSRTY